MVSIIKLLVLQVNELSVWDRKNANFMYVGQPHKSGQYVPVNLAYHYTKTLWYVLA